VTSISGVSSTASLDPTQQTQRKDPFGDVASALGMSTSDLRSALKSGESMSDLATSKGVSRDDLLTAIKKDLPQGAQGTDGSGAAASSTDADALAAKIADTKGLPQGGHHGHGHHHRVSGAATAGSTATTATTAAATSATATATATTSAATTDLATLLSKVGQQATGGNPTGSVDGWL
jgi:hypothetical protein